MTVVFKLICFFKVGGVRLKLYFYENLLEKQKQQLAWNFETRRIHIFDIFIAFYWFKCLE